MILRSPSPAIHPTMIGKAALSGASYRIRVAARPSIAASARPTQNQDENEAPSFFKKTCMGAALAGSMVVVSCSVLLLSPMPSQAYAQMSPVVEDEVEMDASSQARQVCGVLVFIC